MIRRGRYDTPQGVWSFRGPKETLKTRASNIHHVKNSRWWNFFNQTDEKQLWFLSFFHIFFLGIEMIIYMQSSCNVTKMYCCNSPSFMHFYQIFLIFTHYDLFFMISLFSCLFPCIFSQDFFPRFSFIYFHSWQKEIYMLSCSKVYHLFGNL